MADLLNETLRKQIVSDIDSTENKDRKEESLKRFEIFRERQREYILEKLVGEFSTKTVNDMRKITSINLTKRIIDEQASIYKRKPQRNFGEVNDKQKEQLENIYRLAKADVKMKQANKIFKLQDQAAIQIFPGEGKINMRALHPHHYDVVPFPDNPERAFAYVLSVFDKNQYFKSNPAGDTRTNTRTSQSDTSDGVNQTTADADDWMSKRRLVWWSAEHHFVTDGFGRIISEQEPLNPIRRLPFVDIAGEKDFEFFVRGGNGTTEFNLDFGVLLSDTANINRLQGYSQAVIVSDELPSNALVGPNHILHLTPNKDGTPSSFQFVTPSPDMTASLNLLELYLKLFLSSKGMDPKTISGTADSQRFSSGVERLLAMIEKFEASQDDLDLFKAAEEDEVFEIATAWSNEFQGVVGPGELKDELRLATIPDDAFLEINFAPPIVELTTAEKEQSISFRMDNNLMSRVEAIAEERGIDEDEARKVAEQIDEDEGVGESAEMGEGAQGEQHTHSGTGPGAGPGPHAHPMLDGSGQTSTDQGGEGHTHTAPNGQSVGAPQPVATGGDGNGLPQEKEEEES